MILRLCAFLLTFCCANAALAGFTRIESLSNPPFLFITRGAGLWHASASAGWWTVNDAFATPYVVTTAPGSDDIRGTEYDALNNRMVLIRHDTGEIRFHAMDGAYISSISTSFAGNDIDVDPRDGSIWVAYYFGQVRHYAPNGALLGQFNAGFNLTGIAVDTRNESLFLLRADGPGGVNGPLDDELWEFSTAGVSLERHWSSAEIGGNGVGLEYLPEQGKLYVTAQFNAQNPSEPYFSWNIYQDAARVPEPTTLALVFIAAVVTPRYRTGRRKG